MGIKKNKKVTDVFSSKGCEVYLRADIISRLNTFLRSKTEKTLNIGGNPGTGKTFITLKICKNYLYINYYKDKNIRKKVMKTNSKLIIIDEFDKYSLHKRNDSKIVLQHINENNMKLITIGNDLIHTNNSLIFKPYTSQEIELIVRSKMIYELGKEIMDDKTLKVISKKHGSCGDMRSVFNFILSNYQDGAVLLKKDESEAKQDNIHHKLIKDVIESKASNKRLAFKTYQEKCDHIGIPPLHRSDFHTVYDIYN